MGRIRWKKERERERERERGGEGGREGNRSVMTNKEGGRMIWNSMFRAFVCKHSHALDFIPSSSSIARG